MARACWTLPFSISRADVRKLAWLLLLAASPLAAQDDIPWRTSYYPYLFGDPTNGLVFVAHAHRGRQAAYDARVPFDGIYTLEAGIGTRSSRFVTARFRAPLLVPGWRFALDLGAVREGRFGYFGEGADGENTTFTPDPTHPDIFFRMHRTRYFARGEVTRRLTGPLHASLGLGVERFVFASAEDGSFFDNDYINYPLKGNDAGARFSLILDTRDHEFSPTRGLLFEAGVYGGTGQFESRALPPLDEFPYQTSFAGDNYAGGYAHLRAYVSPLRTTVVAARLAGRALSEAAPLDARYTLPGWERDVTVLGGADSHRSFIKGRFAGRGLLLGTLEIRHTLLDFGDYGAISLLAFTDAGRVSADKSFRGTLKGWRVGGGGGIALRVLRSALLTANFAGGPDGFVFSMGNGWAF